MGHSSNTSGKHILWGAPLSLYTGKARSYLIKKGVPYCERLPADADFAARIMPAIGFFVIPVLETPDGTIVQDTTDIILHLESAFPGPRLVPSGPVQRTVAMLIDAFASEPCLKPAMHYRWSYRSQQESFLLAEFGRCVSASRIKAERDAAAAPYIAAMSAYLPALGITPDTIPAVEEAYEDLLAILDAHFNLHPYILGGRPSIADFGLMAPLYAHLARDPYPCTLMKTRAPNVYRWTERMNLAGFEDGEFYGTSDEYLADDAIPETLEPLLALIFKDWGPELQVTDVAFTNWLGRNAGAGAGTVVSEGGARSVHPHVGMIRYALRGRTVQAAAMVHGLWLFDRVATAARALEGDARTRFDALVRRTGGEQVMKIRPLRPMKRDHCALVLA